MPRGVTVTEPRPTGPSRSRFSNRPFPPYRFVPGRSPHPRRDPRGHSFGQTAPRPISPLPEEWRGSDDYLYGIDLYNHGYWWECHEVFEGLWHTAGHQTEQGNFFKALIQLAAANLKLSAGDDRAAENLLCRGMIRLQRIPEFYMGIAVARLTENLRQRITLSRSYAPSIHLDISGHASGAI